MQTKCRCGGTRTPHDKGPGWFTMRCGSCGKVRQQTTKKPSVIPMLQAQFKGQMRK